VKQRRETASKRARERAGRAGEMSALQIAATQRVCRGLVSLPETQLGTVSVSADGNSGFLGEFLVVAKMAIIHTK